MGIGGSLSGITFSGLGSGIDTDSIVRSLIQVESIPMRRLQTQQAVLQGKSAIFGQLKNALRGLATAASGLNSASAYNPIKASSSDATVASISTTGSAVAGTYSLSVSKLAQTHKVASAAQASASAALGLTPGKFSVNGKVIEVASTDTLANVASKINSANVGAVASIIDGGAGQAYLTITSAASGRSASLSLADIGAGNALATLGLIGGASVIREPLPPNGAAGIGFANSTAALESLTGASGIGSTAVTVGSGVIQVDLSTDSLDAIAAKINNPLNGTGATAQVKAVTTNGVTKYRLEIQGTSTIGDEGAIFQILGVVQRQPTNEIVEAQDAEYELDGVSLTSASNEITSVVPGVSFTLLKADEMTPPTTTFTLVRDTAQIKKSMEGFVDAFNSVTAFIKSASQFDKETFESGPLFGDPTAAQIESTLSTMIFNDAAGVVGIYKNLAQLGFGFSDSGELTLDAAVLDSAFANNTEAVSKVLRAAGSTSSNELTFVSSTAATRASSTTGYLVHITAPATKASLIANPGLNGTNPDPETLTFSGAMIGSDYQLVIPPNSLISDVVQLINTDSRLKDVLEASDEGGTLRLTSKRWGSGGDFEVVSNQAANATNSGIGTEDPGARYSSGQNVSGTINGEAATGSGQFLTGGAGNASTEGLQIQYTGNAVNVDVGYVFFSKGIAAQINELVNGYSDSVSGLLTSTENSLQTQIEDLSASIASMDERLERREAELRARFAAMEQAISRIRAQANQLGAIAQR